MAARVQVGTTGEPDEGVAAHAVAMIETVRPCASMR